MAKRKRKQSTAWKGTERRLAALFGTTRRPLSGSNSRSGGRDDSQHPRLFIECKQRRKHAVWSLYSETKVLAEKEGKTPVIGLQQNRMNGMLIVIHTDDLLSVLNELIEARYGKNAAREVKTVIANHKKSKVLVHVSD